MKLKGECNRLHISHASQTPIIDSKPQQSVSQAPITNRRPQPTQSTTPAAPQASQPTSDHPSTQSPTDLSWAYVSGVPNHVITKMVAVCVTKKLGVLVSGCHM